MTNLSKINKLFEIPQTDDIFKQILEVLKNIVDFQYGCIYYTEPRKLITKIGTDKDYKYSVSNNLKYKNTLFGKIILYRQTKFSKEETDILKTASYIISNLIKDNEISKIMKLQVEALQDGYKELKKAEDVKSDFISHISHELRTPLNSIIGVSDFLENEICGKLNAKQKECINDIKASGLTLLGMINEILDLTRLESNSITLNTKTFNISELVYEIENIIKPLCKQKNILFKKNITDFEITADYTKIMQIILNLTGNSIKFTQMGGEINLEIFNNKNNAIFIVKDNGIGINPKFHNKIFEKFVQINKNSPNSTGLGLAIVKEFVTLHKGKIELHSEPNKGSKFIITIPLKFDKK